MASSFRTFQSSGLKFMSDIHRVCFYAKVWRTPTGLAFPSSTFYYRNAFDFYAQGCLNNGNHSALALPRVEKSSASKSLMGLWNLVNVLSFHIMKRKKKKRPRKLQPLPWDSTQTGGTAQPTVRPSHPPFPQFHIPPPNEFFHIWTHTFEMTLAKAPCIFIFYFMKNKIKKCELVLLHSHFVRYNF